MVPVRSFFLTSRMPAGMICRRRGKTGSSRRTYPVKDVKECPASPSLFRAM